jgi:hypothetical protein
VTNIYQLKISTKDIKPSIWRTILVPSNITFLDLHGIIMELFGFEDYHLFGFENSVFGIPISDGTDGTKNASKIKISECFTKIDKLNYTYDFGDDWNFSISLQKVLAHDKNALYPQCIKSKCGMLIEDCGGSYAYELIANWCRNKTKENADALVECLGDDALDWYGNDFDPDKFDINEIKFRRTF